MNHFVNQILLNQDIIIKIEFFVEVLQVEILLLLFNNHLCVIWKSEVVSFKQANKELKDKFKLVDNYITEENVNSHCKYEFIPKKS